jgi:hypothetical protein
MVAAAALTLFSGGAAAQDDYSVTNSQWNGLSRFASLAAGEGLIVESVASIDWSELGPDDILIMLYPTGVVDGADVERFVGGGGKLIIGDDFGSADDILVRMRMFRSHGAGVRTERFYDGLTFAPVARPLAPNHPLAAGVGELTTNHPATLTDVKAGDVVFGFATTEAVVVSGRLNRGVYVAISDPSVLINRMLQFEGNLQFALNLLRFMRNPKTQRIVVMTGSFNLSGSPSDIENPAAATASAKLSRLNDLLRELNDYFLTEKWVRVLAIFVALILGWIALTSLPLRSSIKTDGSWLRARPDAPSQRDFQSVVRDYDDDRPRESFVYPAAVLRDTVNSRLGAELGVSDPLFEVEPKQLLALLREKRGSRAATALAPILPTLLAVPMRAQAASRWEPNHLGKRDFERLYAGTTHLYRTLESNHGR